MPLTITAVIPTRNRPVDLVKAVASIVRQSRLPDELMIVDQSPGDESRVAVESMMRAYAGIQLRYFHDTHITGLVDAKRFASEKASVDVVCFLEDDVVLEPDYLEQIKAGFIAHPRMLGCCGVVTNPPRQPFGYEFLFHLFHRGIYRDPRVGLYGTFHGLGHALIPSTILSGGLSAWRREVFQAVPFDVPNGFHMLEDMDFSSRVARRFGDRLFINPNARLEHHMSPVNREQLGTRQTRKLREFILYYKKRRDWSGALPSLLWLLPGLFLEASFQSIRARAWGPLTGYFVGLWRGLWQPLRESA